MLIQNSNDYVSAPFEITAQDLAIIFDNLDLGVRRQMQIVNDIWEENKWILPRKYRMKNKKRNILKMFCIKSIISIIKMISMYLWKTSKRLQKNWDIK